MTRRYSFVARVPDEPGTLHRVARLLKEHAVNINRIQYDHRIDRNTVFFEVTGSAEGYARVVEELDRIGYLQTGLPTLRLLTLYVWLPHRPGGLFEFLQEVTDARTNIVAIDFDDRGVAPERVELTLNLSESLAIETLLERLKARYRLEIVEYDPTTTRLDDTIYYVRLAEQIRELIGGADDRFLLCLLQDINHVVQELKNRGRDPAETFETCLAAGRRLRETQKEGFFADIQQLRVSEQVRLWCFQLPAGGNTYLLDAGDDLVLVDTGFGCYHDEIVRMMQAQGITDLSRLSRVVVSHADADHSGGAGLYSATALMHPVTHRIGCELSRAYGSRSQESVLEAVYTTLINLFSRYTPATEIRTFRTEPLGYREGFAIIDHLPVGDLVFEVLEGHGGHMHGQCYLYEPDHGLLFPADALINFDSLTDERRNYASIAVYLVTSVNVDSDRAREERQALLRLVAKTDARLASVGRRCLVAGGHGAVSVLEQGRLVSLGEPVPYRPGG
ncbi:MAG TPA: MBL fold metallo-hydrolase [Methanoregulaceae archaeon]|nr:MBL fold metallo-hydrolase [Methanoregulaceae archaeon]